VKPGDLLLYNTVDENVKVSVCFHNGTLGLSRKAMAELFGVDRTLITKHLKNVFKTQELAEESVCAKIAHTAGDGRKNNT